MVPVQSPLILPVLIAFLLISALALHILSKRESTAARSIRVKNGIPSGIVVYSDLDRPGKALFSKRYGIAGKPDYIIKDGASNAHIPVEIKSGQAYKPYRNHVLQLAAYCLLVEENYNNKSNFKEPGWYESHFPEYRFSDNRSGKNGSRNRGNDLIERCRFCSLQAECEQLRLTRATDGPKVEG